MVQDFESIFTFFESIQSLLFYNFFSDIIQVLIIAVPLLVGIEIARFIIRRRFQRNRKFPTEVVKGFFNIIRIASFIIIIFSILVTFKIIDYTVLLNFSTIISTAIGLASAIIVGNLIAGFYTMLSRPYEVGDYIKLEGSGLLAVEGFVTEIGLNYTTIKDAVGIGNIYRIPNKVSMNSQITIFKTKIKKPKKATSVSYKREIFKYSFKTEFEFNKNPKSLMEKFDEICNQWTPKFGYKPEVKYESMYNRLVIVFIINSANLAEAIPLLPDFKKDILVSIYKEGGKPTNV